MFCIHWFLKLYSSTTLLANKAKENRVRLVRRLLGNLYRLKTIISLFVESHLSIFHFQSFRHILNSMPYQKRYCRAFQCEWDNSILVNRLSIYLQKCFLMVVRFCTIVVLWGCLSKCTILLAI